ncbi:MAG: hypothetical protein JNL40_16755 [Cyclobacteriaceae bacterium]|nr:hypothetical protein [Cyclobacteriaceae bacterium]
MKLKLNALVVFLSTLFILSSCGSGGDKDKSKAFEEAGKTLEEEITHLVSEDFPKPSEIPYLVMQTGAEYNQSLINSRDGIDSYLAQPDKSALNLGVYAADMGYLASYDKTQESIEYFHACKRLADELGIIQGFDPDMVKRVEGNIGNRDSLTSILDKAVDQAALYMKGQNSKTGALIITGSFVESLYLATGIIKTYPKSAFADARQRSQILTPLTKLILDQSTSVNEVLDMLNKVDKTEAVNALIKDFTTLKESYSGLNDLKAKIAKGDPNLTFSDETLAGVTKTIEKIRGDIVK